MEGSGMNIKKLGDGQKTLNNKQTTEINKQRRVIRKN